MHHLRKLHKKWSLLREMITISLLLVVFMVCLMPKEVLAQSGQITLDGSFDDWTGQASIDDPRGDAKTDHTDLSAFYFATNPDQEVAYFMAERYQSGSQKIVLRLSIDTNNNGIYDEPDDRIAEVEYSPNPGGSTSVDLYDGGGNFLSRIANDSSWGDAGTGRRVEWGISFEALGIVPYQPVRIVLVSMQGGQISDGVIEVQWSPANALGWFLLIPLGLAGVGFLIYRQKKAS